ncbi:hypothetical protein QBC43DRAFT_246769, partial [Cladorrhinum sp. PSN259]
MSSSQIRTSRAFDIITTDLIAKNPRKYTRYLRPRQIFFSSFPPSGEFVRLHTPSTNLLCAFYALMLSYTHQHPNLKPVPALSQLQDIFERQKKEFRELTGMDNEGDLTGDQLASVFAEWVRVYFEGRKRGQLGYLSVVEEWEYGDEENENGREVPVMMDTGEVSVEEEEREDIVRVWVWNDGGWVGGGMGHWEGVKRVETE